MGTASYSQEQAAGVAIVVADAAEPGCRPTLAS
jgi:hypothetical protein